MSDPFYAQDPERQHTLIAARPSMYYPLIGALKVDQILLLYFIKLFKISNNFQKDMDSLTGNRLYYCSSPLLCTFHTESGVTRIRVQVLQYVFDKSTVESKQTREWEVKFVFSKT